MTPEVRLEVDSCPEPNTGCQIWLGSSSSGYGRIKFRGKLDGVHRVAWMLSGRDIPEGFQILHKCDMPLCVNVCHLFIGTIRDNVMDMYRKGRSRKGVPTLPYGVRPCGQKFQVKVRQGRKFHYLGVFETAEEASSVATTFRNQLS